MERSRSAVEPEKAHGDDLELLELLELALAQRTGMRVDFFGVTIGAVPHGAPTAIGALAGWPTTAPGGASRVLSRQTDPRS